MMTKNKKVKRSGSDRILEINLIVALSVLALIMVYPLIIVVSTSFSSPAAATSGRVWFLPVDFS